MSFKYGDRVMVNQLSSTHPLTRWSGFEGIVVGPILSGYVSVDMNGAFYGMLGSYAVINIEVTDLTAVSPQASQYSVPVAGTYNTAVSTVYKGSINPNEHLLAGIMTNLDNHTPYDNKCSCGADVTYGPEGAEFFHSDWCSKYKRNPYGSGK